MILERIINRKDVTMWAGNLGSKKEKAVNRYGHSSEASGYLNCGGVSKVAQ
jgi:hypothetical protein